MIGQNRRKPEMNTKHTKKKERPCAQLTALGSIIENSNHNIIIVVTSMVIFDKIERTWIDWAVLTYDYIYALVALMWSLIQLYVVIVRGLSEIYFSYSVLASFRAMLFFRWNRNQIEFTIRLLNSRKSD